MKLVGGFTEQYIDPVKGNCPAANNSTGRNSAPQNIRTRKFPDGQQRREYCHQNAAACGPEGNASDHFRIQEATLFPTRLRVFQIYPRVMNLLAKPPYSTVSFKIMALGWQYNHPAIFALLIPG
jgi:hypothetical protein